MEEIKKAYGDTKIVPSKRLTELESLEPIWKIKSPVTIAESSTKIISNIKDLMQLSHSYEIKPKFYNSDEDIEREVLWKRLIMFLEKDFSIQQQRVIINEINK